MVKCNSYHEFVCKGYCYGTCEECSCGGDRTKCDFYPANRNPKNVAKYEKEHAPKFGEWISVKDDLPPINQEVLVHSMLGRFAVDYRYSGAEEVGDSEFCHYAVDFWMPLPEPPKKSEG